MDYNIYIHHDEYRQRNLVTAAYKMIKDMHFLVHRRIVYRVFSSLYLSLHFLFISVSHRFPYRNAFFMEPLQSF